MKKTLTRRNFVRSGALTAAALAAPPGILALAGSSLPAAASSPLRLGLARYTFRNFTRPQTIVFMKQLQVFALNAKDVKDHLPTDPQEENAALTDYTTAGISLHAAGVIYFEKNEDADIRSKFDYCKRAGVDVLVAGVLAPEILLRIDEFVKEYDIRFAIHNHGPEDKVFPSPL